MNLSASSRLLVCRTPRYSEVSRRATCSVWQSGRMCRPPRRHVRRCRRSSGTISRERGLEAVEAAQRFDEVDRGQGQVVADVRRRDEVGIVGQCGRQGRFRSEVGVVDSLRDFGRRDDAVEIDWRYGITENWREAARRILRPGRVILTFEGIGLGSPGAAGGTVTTFSSLLSRFPGSVACHSRAHPRSGESSRLNDGLPRLLVAGVTNLLRTFDQISCCISFQKYVTYTAW